MTSCGKNRALEYPRGRQADSRDPTTSTRRVKMGAECCSHRLENRAGIPLSVRTPRDNSIQQFPAVEQLSHKVHLVAVNACSQ